MVRGLANSVFGARIELKVNKSNSAAFRKEIQDYVDTVTQSKPIVIKNFKFDMSPAQRTTLVKQLQDELAGANYDIPLNRINADNAIKNLKGQITTMLEGLNVEGVKAFVGDIDTGGSTKKSSGGAKQLSADARAAKKELSALNGQLNSLQKKINNLGAGNGDFEELAADCKKYRIEIEQTLDAVKTGNVGGVDELNAKVALLAQRYNEAHEAAKKSADGGAAAARKQISQQQQAANLLQQTQKYIGDHTRAYAAYGAQFDAIVKSLGEVAASGEATEENAAKLANAKLQLTQLKTAADAAGISGLTLGERFKKGIEKFGGWAAITATIQKTVAVVKRMASAVKEVDDAMTELKKVTDLTSGAYDAIYIKSVKTAKAVGASIADTINSTADFARLGFNAEDASELAKAALIYKNVGDGVADITTASESLISTMKGFGIEAENAMHIVDAFNEVGNNFAISSTGIGDALQRSAAALSAAGNTLEESIGMVTAMNAVIQNPESVGTALKTLTMYLRAAKTEAEAAGEDTEGMAVSVSKLREELLLLTDNKVDIMIDDTEFKSTYQIIKDLASVWNELTDVTQANVLNIIGGKRNANSVSALIENFADAEAASIAAANSMGSAYAENQSYLDSISGRLTKIQTTFESISNNVINSGLVKVVLDIVNGLLGVVEQLSKIGAVIPLVTGGLLLLRNLDLSSTVNAIARQAVLLQDSVETAKTISASVSALSGSQFKLLLKSLDANGMKITAAELRKIVGAFGDVKEGAEDAGGAFQKASGLAVSKTALIVAAITTLASVGFAVYDGIKQREQELIQKAHELTEAISENKKTYDDNISTIKGLSSRYYELTSKMQENGGQAALTREEYDEYHAIIGQILDISPTLVDRYGAEGQALSEYTDLIIAATQAQDDWLQSQMNETFSPDNSKTVFKGAAKEYKNATQQFEDAHIDMISILLDGFNNDMQEAFREYLLDVGALTMDNIWLWDNPVAYVDALMEDFDAFVEYINNTPVFDGVQTLAAQGLQGIQNAVDAMKDAVEPAYEYLINWDKYVDEDKDGKHFNLRELDADTYDDALDVIRGVAEEAARLKMSSGDAVDLMYESISRLVEVTSEDSIANYLSSMIDGLKDGTTGWSDFVDVLDNYEQHLLDLGESEYVAEAAAGYFYDLADAAMVAEKAAANTGKTVTASYEETGDVLGKVIEYADLNAQALKEMEENGRLSLETVKKFLDAGLGEMLVAMANFKGGKRIDSWYAYNETDLKKHTQSMLEYEGVTEQAKQTADEFWEAAKGSETSSAVDSAIQTAKKYADLNAMAFENLYDDDLSNDIEVKIAFDDAKLSDFLKEVDKFSEDGTYLGKGFEHDEAALIALTQELLKTNDVFGASEQSVWNYWKAIKAVEDTGSDVDAFNKFAQLAELNAKALDEMSKYQNIQYPTYLEFLQNNLGHLISFDSGMPTYDNKAAEQLKYIADGIANTGAVAAEAKPMMDAYWESVKATTEPIDGISAALTINDLYDKAKKDIAEYGKIGSETLNSFREELGELGLNFEDYLFKDKDGQFVDVFVNALARLQRGFLDTTNESEEFKNAIAADFAAINIGDAVDIDEKTKAAYAEAQQMVDAVAQAVQDLASEEGRLSESTVSAFSDLLGSQDIDDYFTWSEDVKGWIDMDTAALRIFTEALYDGTVGADHFRESSLAAFDRAAIGEVATESERLIALWRDMESQLGLISTAWSDMQEDDGVLTVGNAADLTEAFGESAVNAFEMSDGSTQYKANFDAIHDYLVAKLGEDDIGRTLIGVFEAAFAQIMVKADTTFEDMNTALNNAFNNTDLIARVKKEMEESGRLSFETVLKMFNTYGKDAAELLTEITHISGGMETDKFFTADYERLINWDRAAIKAIDDTGTLTSEYDNLIAAVLAGEEIKSPFETLTDGISTAKDYLSTMEGAYGDMLDSGALTFDTISDLMGTFGEGWTDVVALDETTGKFEILTDKVRELALEQLRNAGATDEVIAAYERQFDAAMKAVEESQKEAEIEAKITVETEGLTDVISAIKESASATGLGVDAIDKLRERYKNIQSDGYALVDLFEATSNGVHLNADALDALEGKYEQLKLAEYNAEFESLQKQFERINGLIERGGNAELYAQRNQILQQMNDVDMLRTQYQGLISAYNKWMEASSGPEDGDMYDSAKEGIASAKELRDAGLVGTNEFKAAAEFLISPENLEKAGDSLSALVAEFDKAYPTMQRYFTDSAQGAKNFKDDVNKLHDDWVTYNEETGEWSIEIPDTETLANEMGIGVEAVEAIIRKLKDYGWNVDFSPAQKEIDDLTADAETAADTLSTMDEETPEFDFDVNNIERVEEQIQQAYDTFAKYKNEDGTWNLQMEGAKEARDIMVALIRKRQELEKPVIMNVNAGEVSGGLGETLRTLQQIYTLRDQLEVEIASGEDTTKTAEELETLRQKLVALDEANPDILASLGVDDLSNVQSVLDAVAAIPAEKLVEIGVDPTLIDGYLATDITKNATVVWRNDDKEVNKFLKKKITKIAYLKWVNTGASSGVSSSSSGGSSGGSDDVINEANGTANVNGTAYAHGDWSTKDSGIALMGELGPEMIVRNGKFFTVGDNGAGFYRYRKGDIIFNHVQTKQLLENGQITYGKRRGNVFVHGTAFAGSSASGSSSGPNGGFYDNPSSSSGSSSGSSSSSGGNKPSKPNKPNKPPNLETLLNQYEDMLELLEHLIEHQQFLYDQAENGLDYTAMGDSLQEQARLYQEMMMKALEAIEAMRKKGATDGDEELQAMEEAYWEAYNNFHEILDQINSLYVDALNDKIDDLQSAYHNLSTAADEYNNTGGISIDTYQALLENGIQYLGLLDQINGQYVLNEEAINRLIAAKKEQLAVESALSYLNQLTTALTEGDTNLVNALVNATEQIGDATWNAVYAQLEALKALGLTNEQYLQVLENINNLRNMTNQVVSDITSDDVQDALDDQADSVKDILELTQDLIRHEVEEQIDAINDQIDAYRKIVDLKKEALATSREQESYEKSVLEKTKAIAELQARIEILSLDDSAAAQAELAALYEQLRELQDELHGIQSDHAHEQQTTALDDMADQYEEGRQNEIQALQDSIDSAEELYQLAIARIRDSWDTLYQDLIDWNSEFGNTLNSEIAQSWDDATAAAERYGSYLAALAALGGYAVPGFPPPSGNATGGSDVPQYHRGGLVTDAGAINADEALAVLRQGELVLTEDDQEALYEIIDFQQALSAKIGAAIGSLRELFSSSLPTFGDIGGMPLAAEAAGAFTFSPSIEVNITGSGLADDREASKFGNQIANTAIDKLYEAFEKRGVTSFFGSHFKK